MQVLISACRELPYGKLFDVSWMFVLLPAEKRFFPSCIERYIMALELDLLLGWPWFRLTDF